VPAAAYSCWTYPAGESTVGVADAMYAPLPPESSVNVADGPAGREGARVVADAVADGVGVAPPAAGVGEWVLLEHAVRTITKPTTVLCAQMLKVSFTQPPRDGVTC
jgi:hypothetical protein